MPTHLLHSVKHNYVPVIWTDGICYDLDGFPMVLTGFYHLYRVVK